MGRHGNLSPPIDLMDGLPGGCRQADRPGHLAQFGIQAGGEAVGNEDVLIEDGHLFRDFAIVDSFVLGALLEIALVNANTQKERMSGELRQDGATMLHFAGAQEGGVRRGKTDQYGVFKSLFDSAAIGGDDPLNPVQPAFDRVSGTKLIERRPGAVVPADDGIKKNLIAARIHDIR